MITEQPIIYRKVYQCGGCNAYVNPDDGRCEYCGGYLDNGSRISGVVIDNLDMDLHFMLGGDILQEPYKFGYSLGDITSMMPLCKEMANSLGRVSKELTEDEIKCLHRALKCLIEEPSPRYQQEIYNQSVPNIVMTATIAKGQFYSERGNSSLWSFSDTPSAGQFGVIKIPPRLFDRTSWLMNFDDMSNSGLRDDGTSEWLNSALFGGTSGNALRVLENAVILILGFADLPKAYGKSYSPINGFQLTIDGKVRPIVETGNSFRASEFPSIKLPSSYLLTNKTVFNIKLLVDKELADKAVCAYPIGLMFTTEPILRHTGKMSGSIYDVITYT